MHVMILSTRSERYSCKCVQSELWELNMHTHWIKATLSTAVAQSQGRRFKRLEQTVREASSAAAPALPRDADSRARTR